jgi:hypothetical protein
MQNLVAGKSSKTKYKRSFFIPTSFSFNLISNVIIYTQSLSTTIEYFVGELRNHRQQNCEKGDDDSNNKQPERSPVKCINIVNGIILFQYPVKHDDQ